jgi:hypothetical protein
MHPGHRSCLYHPVWAYDWCKTLIGDSNFVSTKYLEMWRWRCWRLLHRFEFALPFRECEQELHEMFDLKSSTGAIEGLVEHEGVQPKTIEVFENGD